MKRLARDAVVAGRGAAAARADRQLLLLPAAAGPPDATPGAAVLVAGLAAAVGAEVRLPALLAWPGAVSSSTSASSPCSGDEGGGGGGGEKERVYTAFTAAKAAWMRQIVGFALSKPSQAAAHLAYELVEGLAPSQHLKALCLRLLSLPTDFY